MARRATFIQGQRAKKDNVLLLDAGNSISGGQGPAATTKGQVIVEAMNMMGYDAMTLGYLDLLLGPDVLKQRMEEADFPFLSANVVDAKTGEPFAKPYVLLERGGHTIAIIGATSGSSAPLPAAPGQSVELRVNEPVPAVQRALDDIGGQADIVIMLSHLGVDRDQQLGAEAPEIDVIIGGYARTLLVPTRFEDRGPIIAQAGYRGEWVGWIDVVFDAKGNQTNFRGETVALTEDLYLDNAEMAEFVKKIKAAN